MPNMKHDAGKNHYIESARERNLSAETVAKYPKPKKKGSNAQYKADLQQWKIDTGVQQWFETEVYNVGPQGQSGLNRDATIKRQEEVFNEQLDAGVAQQPNREIRPDKVEMIDKPFDGNKAANLSHRGPAYARRKRTAKRGSLRIQR